MNQISISFSDKHKIAYDKVRAIAARTGITLNMAVLGIILDFLKRNGEIELVPDEAVEARLKRNVQMKAIEKESVYES